MRTNALTCAAVLLGLLGAGPAFARSDGPDILIRDGTIIATAADYEMDGTMWVTFATQQDSVIWLYRSTDHGLAWQFEQGFVVGDFLPAQLGLVVGEGDSAFVHIFFNDIELHCVRLIRYNPANRQSDQTVVIYADTVHDFAVCRDYSGSNYWLYAAVTTGGSTPNPRALCFLRSSTYGRQWTLMDSSDIAFQDPHISAGAGTYIYFTGYAPEYWGGSVVAWINTLWLNSSNWHRTWWPDSEEVRNPVIAAAFTMPESLAMAWLVYAKDCQNSGDWDLMYTYTWGVLSWSLEETLAFTSAADEWLPDLRSYISLGNQYINLSYVNELGQDRRVYRQYANAANPTAWSDTLRINTGNAGTGSDVRPKLCYTPGGPFSGAGCVFVGAGLNGCWWNAPYPSGVEAPEPAVAVTRLDVRPSIGRAPFHIRAASPASLSIRDRVGRLVRSLEADRSGSTDWDGRDELGRPVPNGVYFCRFAAGDYTGTEKLVLQR